MKKIIILFLILCIIPINCCVIAAPGMTQLPTDDGASGTSSQSSILGDLDSYRQSPQNSQKFNNMVSVILSIFQVGGSLISVICLIALGIKYMLGSVEEKANYKKTLLPFVLGAVMVLGISNFVNVIYQIAIGIT